MANLKFWNKVWTCFIRDQLAPIFRSRIALLEKVLDENLKASLSDITTTMFVQVCTIEPMEEVTTKSKRCPFYLIFVAIFYIVLQLLILFFATFDLVFLFILWYLLSGFNLSWFAHPDHKLLLCHMGKHGSTTWARCPRLNMFLFQVSPIAFKYFKTWSIFWTLVCFSYFYYMYTGQEPERPGPSMQTRARRWNIRNWGGFNIYISLEKQCCFINIVSLRWEDAAYSPRY